MSKNNTKYKCTLNHYFRETMLDIYDFGSIRLVWNTVCMRYFFTATSAHVAASLLQACCFEHCHQVDIRMRSHCLLRLDNNKSAASCQLAWCKLIVKTFYPQAWCILFQQLVTNLQILDCNKSDFHRLAATGWIQQTCHNLLTTCSKPVKSTTCSKSEAFLAVLANHIIMWEKQKRSVGC